MARRGCISFSRSANSLLKALEDGDSESIEAATASLKESANEFFKEYDQVVDQKLFAAGMSAYYSISPKEYVPKIIIDAMDKYKCAPKWAKKTYKKVHFCQQRKVYVVFRKPFC